MTDADSRECDQRPGSVADHSSYRYVPSCAVAEPCYPFAMHPAVFRKLRRSTAAVLVAVSVGALLSVLNATGASAANIAGMTVFLDPGHSGATDASLTRQVTNGRGGTKDCQATGTATNDGFPEHRFTWEVVSLIRGELNQMGVLTEMSRDDDNSVGPCIDQRAAKANAMHPDAIVSIHADGGPPSGRGFHVNYSSPPLNEAQTGPAMQLATTMRHSLVESGLQESTYVGSNGLYGRADLAGLNLAEYPAILVELGNMRNADDAAQMESADGRAMYAAAVTNGIVAYLSGKAPA
jgi:N-acetylmuramoyl-L-alanine amidase